jgi:hypothetical protein
MTHLRMQLRTLAVGAAAATALAAASLACSTKGATPDAAAGSSTASADAAAAANVPGSAAMTGEPTSAQISEYPLDMDKLRKLQRTMNGFATAAERDPRLGQALATGSSTTTAQTVALLEGNATARGILRDAGWSARDYVMTTAAMMQAAVIESTLAQRGDAALPAGHSMRNIEFMKAHRAEIAAMRDASIDAGR